MDGVLVEPDLPTMSKTPDVARYLRCSEPTVRALIRTKRLPAVKVGRGYRVSREALLAFVSDKKVDAA